jgi:hypothetical protein
VTPSASRGGKRKWNERREEEESEKLAGRGWDWGVEGGERAGYVGESKRAKYERSKAHILWCQMLRIVSTLLSAASKNLSFRLSFSLSYSFCLLFLSLFLSSFYNMLQKSSVQLRGNLREENSEISEHLIPTHQHPRTFGRSAGTHCLFDSNAFRNISMECLAAVFAEITIHWPSLWLKNYESFSLQQIR